ncbi:MAG: xanthine dehydrogenase [Clostridiales bacterium]|nr:xanthine dehydrogenase [Clostridiales bacterium]
MISFDFEYYRPDSIKEATDVYAQLHEEGKSPLYFSGGTEVITMARKGALKFDALIDLKNIEEMNVYRKDEDGIYFGANMTLNEAAEMKDFPLIREVVRTIGDHTIRNRITLGGNICGRLPYREALLPFLLYDAQVYIAGINGIKALSINEAFNKRLVLSKGEFVIGFKVKESFMDTKYLNIRKVKTSEIDYPLFHIASIKDEEGIKIAVSGLCAYPFRSYELDKHINCNSEPDEIINNVYQFIPGTIKEDNIASAEYRKALFELNLEKILEKWGEA